MKQNWSIKITLSTMGFNLAHRCFYTHSLNNRLETHTSQANISIITSILPSYKQAALVKLMHGKPWSSRHNNSCIYKRVFKVKRCIYTGTMMTQANYLLSSQAAYLNEAFILAGGIFSKKTKKNFGNCPGGFTNFETHRAVMNWFWNRVRYESSGLLLKINIFPY